MSNELPGSFVLTVGWHGVALDESLHVLGKEFPWNKCSQRTRNAFDRNNLDYQYDSDKPLTYGTMLKFGRERAMLLRNIGISSMNELDSIMELVGLSDRWIRS